MRRKDFVGLFYSSAILLLNVSIYINACSESFLEKWHVSLRQLTTPSFHSQGQIGTGFFLPSGRERACFLSLLLLCRRDGGGETLTHILFRTLLFPRPCAVSLSPSLFHFFGTQVSPSHTTKLNASESDDRTFP